MKETGKLSKELTQSMLRAEQVMQSMERYSMKRMDGIFSGKVDTSVLTYLGDESIDLNEWHLYRIDELVYSEKEGLKREAIENVLSTFRGMDDVNILYVILGDTDKVSFYMGVSKNLYLEAWDQKQQGKADLSIESYGPHIMKPSLEGNFVGSQITEVADYTEKQSIINRIRSSKSSGFINGVPGFVEQALGESKDFQGVERLVDTMVGTDFTLVVIATPCTGKDVVKLEHRVNRLVNLVEPIGKLSKQETLMDQYQTSEDTTEGVNRNVGTAKSVDSSSSVSNTKNDVKDSREDFSVQSNASKNDTTTDQSAQTESHGMNTVQSRDISNQTGSERNPDVNRRSESTDNNMSYQDNTSKSVAHTNQWSDSKTSSTSTTSSQSVSKASDTRTSQSRNMSVQKSHNISNRTGKSSSDSLQTTYSLQLEKKAVLNVLKYIDEVFQQRVDKGKSKGSYVVSTYLGTRTNRATLYRLANTVMGLYGGEKGNLEPLTFVELTHWQNKDNEEALSARKIFENFQIPVIESKKEIWKSVYSKVVYETLDKESIGSWLTGDELGLLMGMPQREVLGVSARNEVEYGLNPKAMNEIDVDKSIELGSLVHHGDVRKDNKIYIEKKNLSKHTFICGVTGSGKTTTCQSILLGTDLPFLVIEPAKTEYRALMNQPGGEDVIYFTLGRQDIAPFFLNPFEIIEGESITSRADMLKAAINAAFESEAAIPQIIEAATYEVYKKKGWNIRTNVWINPSTGKEDNPFAPDSYAFPMLSDFINVVETVTKAQGFGERLEAEYLGSLKARLQALTVGAKGMMLNTPRSIDFKSLVNKRVVIELEEIKDGTEKSLIMGFIITNLLEAIKYQYRENQNFQHITLVEEAHRLLSKYEPGDSPNKKRGVDIFADMLAEVRKYGESLIIVDQIPNKMTPEVLKNTNTKIVHKIFATDDKDAIGNMMALNDEQKEFLSYLEVGRAIVITEGWKKPVQVQVHPRAETNDSISGLNPKELEKQLAEKAYAYYAEHNSTGVLPGFTTFHDKVTPNIVKKYFELHQKDVMLHDQRLRNLLSGRVNISDANTLFTYLTSIFTEFNLSIMIDKVLSKKENLYESYFWGQLGCRVNSENRETLYSILSEIIQLILENDELKREQYMSSEQKGFHAKQKEFTKYLK